VVGSAPLAHDVDDPAVDALGGDGAEAAERGRDVAGGVDVLEAQGHEAGGRRVGDEPDPRSGDDGQGPLGADEHPADVATVLGQQVLEGVAADLAAEPAELGADRREVRVGEVGQAGDDVVGSRQ
jgi:hypothetical protein